MLSGFMPYAFRKRFAETLTAMTEAAETLKEMEELEGKYATSNC